MKRAPGSWASLEMHQLSGRDAATQFFTGYVLEKSLSMDNIFVIAMIFAYFRVPLKNQHRLLFWGIMGAVVLRGVMIALGAALIDRFDWIIYVFGGLLLVSAAKMMTDRTTENVRARRRTWWCASAAASVPGDSRDRQRTVLRAAERPVGGHAPVSWR